MVVHADPGPRSFSAELCAVVTSTLESSGHEVDLADLYRDGFDPVMSAREWEAYETDTPILSAEVGDYANRVRSADVLVFVFPSWWGGLPAILKGWLDRVLVPGVGFVFDEPGRVKPGLTNIRRVVGVTTHEGSAVSVRLRGDAGRRTLARTLQMNTRRRARPWWLVLYGTGGATAEDRADFVRRVRRRLESL